MSARLLAGFVAPARRAGRAILPALLSLAVLACGGGVGGTGTPGPSAIEAGQTPPSASAGVGTVPATGSPSATGDASAPPDPTIDRPWATATLTDVTTGQPFRIADLVAAGKVVFVETMAVWCTNCRQQQIEATTAFETLDPGRVAWIALDVESSETAEALAGYRDQNGFPFTYAISGTDVSRALVADFGDVVLSPPSVNVIVIGSDGQISHLRGHHGVDEIRQLAADHGA